MRMGWFEKIGLGTVSLSVAVVVGDRLAYVLDLLWWIR